MLGILTFAAAQAHGQSSCLPEYTALQTMESVQAGQAFVRPLISENAQGYFTTKVRLEGEVPAQGGGLKMRVRFDPAFDGVSLPYNLYAVLVVSGGQVLLWEDYTMDCRGPGLGFFPGRIIELPTVKQVGAGPQKLQIMVWGKL